MALNCSLVPLASVEEVPVTASEASIAGVTVNLVLPLTEPKVAVTVIEPTLKEVTCPSVPGALPTVATVLSDDDHETEVVRSWVLLSEKVPVALSCWLRPSGEDAFGGEMAMLVKVAGVTVRLTPGLVTTSGAPDHPITLAVMDTVPVGMATAVTVPVLFTGTFIGSELVQFTAEVTGTAEGLSVYTPLAVNVVEVPIAIELLGVLMIS